MYRLPPETQENPGTNEVTPLLQDDVCSNDPDLYAIGGDPEFADLAIYDVQPDTDDVIGALFSAWLQFPPRKASESDHGHSEFLDPRALNAMSTVWRRMKAERDIFPESSVIIQGLVESMVEYLYPLHMRKPDDVEDVFKDFMAYARDFVAENWQLVLDGIEEKEIEETRKERIRRKRERLCRIQERLQRQTGGAPEYVDPAVCDAQKDIDVVVETLFSAWLQFPPRKSDESNEEGSAILSPSALNAMSTAWRQIKAERDVLPESEVIIEGLVESMVEYLYSLLERRHDGVEDATKEDFVAHVKGIVTQNLQLLLDRIEEEDREVARKERIRIKKERQQIIKDRLQKRKETEELLFFYEGLSRPNPPVPKNWITFCLIFCHRCSCFQLQVPLHTLLLAWPLSIGIMGGLHMWQCPMSALMACAMMVVGVTGTAALLMRLSFVCYKKFSRGDIAWIPWILLKITEFVCLDFLAVQLYYFYTESPNLVSGSQKFCNETFYSFVHWMNYASIAISSVWLFVYSIKGLLWFRGKKFFYLIEWS